MKQLYRLIAVVAVALTASGAVQAQTSSLLGSGDIKVGIFNPSNSDARTISATTQLSIGADYTFPGLLNSLLPNVYADFEGASSNGSHVNTAGIGIAGKYHVPGSSLTGLGPYLGAGVGVYREDINTSDPTNSGTSTSVGGKVFAGITFSRYLVEANYQFLESEHGVNPSGAGLQVGITF